MEKRKNLCVSLEQTNHKRVKLLKLQGDETYQSLLCKIKAKFGVTEESPVTVSARVEKDGLFVEVDETDEETIQDAIEVKIIKSATAATSEGVATIASQPIPFSSNMKVSRIFCLVGHLFCLVHKVALVTKFDKHSCLDNKMQY